MFIKDKEFLKYVFELAQECKGDFGKFGDFAECYKIPVESIIKGCDDSDYMALYNEVTNNNDVLDSDFVEVLLELQKACVTNNDAKIMDCAKTIDYLNTINHIKKYND